LTAGRPTNFLIVMIVAWMTPLHAIADSTAVYGLPADLEYREALFYSHQGKDVPALVRLLAAQTEHSAVPDKSTLLLGSLYASNGHREEATRIFQQITSGNAEAAIRDHAWFLLARLRSEQGDLPGAQAALDRIEGSLPETIEPERRMLQVQLHTRSRDFERALSDLRDWPDCDALKDYAQFNVGVAMVASGYVDDGAVVLGEVGLTEASNEEQRSLRDKANLALGYTLLRTGRFDQSRQALSRVRLQGPFSNQALLGAGWTSAEDERYQRALVPWMEVSERDPFDPAVQESMLAIPFAMVRLGALEQAADRYSTAIATFAATSRQIDETVGDVREGHFTDTILADSEAPDRQAWSDLPALYPVLAANVVQNGLDNLRDLGRLRTSLDTRRRNIEVFRQELATREIANQRQKALLEARFAGAVIDELANRTSAFAARLDEIEAANDWLALATVGEFEMWDAAATVERHPSANKPIRESDDLRDKTALIKGVLQWTLDEEFERRLAQVREEQGEAHRALAELQNLRRQIEAAIEEERLVIADLQTRLEAAAPRVNSLIVRVDETISRQRTESEELIVNELLAGKERLQVNSAQARFALAAIYDLAARQHRNEEVSR
jgi:tetratricopeptide (TPR) repeat protein